MKLTPELKQHVLDKYIDGMGTSQNKQYITFVQGFLKFATALDKDSVIKYTQHLKEEGYAAGSIELMQRTIRSAFKRNGIPWPLKRGENATIPASEERALALSPNTIKLMVDSALSGKLDVLQTWFLAAATIYGMRRAEIADIGPHRIDLQNQSLYVETKKHGRERYHHIPDEIVPIVRQAVPYMQKISPRFVTDSFYEIEDACKIEHIPDTGWHSIRRSLEYHLIEAGITELSVAEFMRWSKRSRTDMVARYHSVRFVGVDKDGMDIGNDKVQDVAVFEKHPFLPYWRV